MTVISCVAVRKEKNVGVAWKFKGRLGGRIELNATSPTIRYRTTIYDNQHRYESPE